MVRGIRGPTGVTEDRGKDPRVSPGSRSSDSNESAKMGAGTGEWKNLSSIYLVRITSPENHSWRRRVEGAPA